MLHDNHKKRDHFIDCMGQHSPRILNGGDPMIFVVLIQFQYRHFLHSCGDRTEMTLQNGHQFFLCLKVILALLVLENTNIGLYAVSKNLVFLVFLKIKKNSSKFRFHKYQKMF